MKWGGRERWKHQFVVSLIYASLVDSYMCPGQGSTHNLGVLGGPSNQLNYLARVKSTGFRGDRHALGPSLGPARESLCKV